MSQWCLIVFFLSLFQTCFLSSSSSPQLCPHETRDALLQLKQMHYHHVHPSSDYHPLKSWNPDSDCCYWKGITCDGTTGHVVGLDLSDSSLYGSIHSNSSLFHLQHLQTLDLSRNAFDYFAPSGFDKLSRLIHLLLSNNRFSGQVPSQISQLTDLVSLDLSFNEFRGQIPYEISRLTKLVFLDLSCERFSELEIPNLGAFVQNLSNLRELRLDQMNLSAQNNKDWCHHVSSALPNLQVLSMTNSSLIGPLDASISNLRVLSELSLGLNRNLSSTVPSHLVNLTSLTVLDLSYCGFYGDFPSNVFLQPSLQMITLSNNPLLSIHLPELPQVNNSSLRYLDIGNIEFQGKFPRSIGSYKFLQVLYLFNCNVSGLIPPSLGNLTYLTNLDLSGNRFSGSIPSFFTGRFPHLKGLYLRDNLLQGPIPSFFLVSLSWLDLSNNQFSGLTNEPIHNISSFSSPRIFYLSGNHLKGEDLMRSISKVKGTFTVLDLSFNDFGYIGGGKNLSYDSLSVNRSDDSFLNAQIDSLNMSSCNMSRFPVFLRNQKELYELDLSSNRIDGLIPKWIWRANLSRLFLGNNSLTGLELPLPNHSFNIVALDLHSNMIQDCLSITAPCYPPTFNQSISEFVSSILGNLMPFLSEARFFSISDNNLTGKIPFSICNAHNLEFLEMANNQLSGTIPTCLGNLRVLNLGSNKLRGPIPPTIFTNGCVLHTLKLNKNMLQGQVPGSLASCKELEVLDIGDNQLNGYFPYWLGNLSKLRVLAMRSNNFGGPIGQVSSVNSPFPNLHVFDLSFNNFTGNLPLQYILHWNAMITNEDDSELNYIGFLGYAGFYYKDALFVVDKGIYLEMGSILTAFTIVDLSNNKFNGGIPDAMGDLKSLRLLNLSGNSLTGQIPSSLGNLSKLEALDLSRNNISGQIPSQLTSLTFLELLNLSDNNLTGRIPQGNQFDTFLNTSYEGNAGLCGSPLSRQCGITDRALPPTLTLQQEEDSACLFDWKFAIAGYCSGLIIGVVIGQQLFWRKNQFFTWSLRIRGSKKRKEYKRKLHNRGG